jgi:hypothetical protein
MTLPQALWEQVRQRAGTGRFTIDRLRLNRPPLVEYRRRRQLQADSLRLLE